MSSAMTNTNPAVACSVVRTPATRTVRGTVSVDTVAVAFRERGDVGDSAYAPPMVIPPERRMAGTVVSRDDQRMAATASAGFGVPAPAVRPTGPGGRRAGALRGCAPGSPRVPAVVSGAAHPLLVPRPARTALVGHRGRYRCASRRKEARRES
ncbi:hypothetical protein GCM10023108_55730 [Saccharopolyspora hordei]